MLQTLFWLFQCSKNPRCLDRPKQISKEVAKVSWEKNFKKILHGQKLTIPAIVSGILRVEVCQDDPPIQYLEYSYCYFRISRRVSARDYTEYNISYAILWGLINGDLTVNLIFGKKNNSFQKVPFAYHLSNDLKENELKSKQIDWLFTFCFLVTD